MAEDASAASVPGAQPVLSSAGDGGKRKFDDPSSDAPSAGNGQQPGVYSSVPPVTDFDLAKQRAAEIAAKLLNEGIAKRTRTDSNDHSSNLAPSDGGLGFLNQSSFQDKPQYEFQRTDLGQLSQGQGAFGVHQGIGSETRTMDVPNAKVGLVIGKGGETIKNLQHQSGARIQVTRDADADPRVPTRQVALMGTLEQINKAQQLIEEVISEASSGSGAGMPSRGFSAVAPPGESIQIKVPNSKVGLIIGRGGESIKSLQQRSGARIQVQSDRETTPGSTERLITLIGSKKQTDMAADLVKEILDPVSCSQCPGYENSTDWAATVSHKYMQVLCR
eukprot:TRINITY_DN1654_c0_g2_i1.p1 TRINITY_DN1654_c0_g2~~TRINITY_DN1654_c0_g2_i1.p1  ORF type:complete len:341 (-),score=46.04 TRINITY_DN1654_c0_g2_i1:855-1853(-)